MGAKVQVKIISEFPKEAPFYLYSHWESESIEDILKISLNSERGRSCWNDAEYLSRFIFEDMIGEEFGSYKGFGISTEEHSDIEKLVIVDCLQKKVRVKDIFQGFPSEIKEYESFEEFIEA